MFNVVGHDYGKALERAWREEGIEGFDNNPGDICEDEEGGDWERLYETELPAAELPGVIETLELILQERA